MSAGSGLLRRASVADPERPHFETFVTLDGRPVPRCFAFDADEGWVDVWSCGPALGGAWERTWVLERLHGRVAAYHHRPRWWPA